MKPTVSVKLQPTPAQAQALLDTLVRANDAANDISQIAWDKQTFGQFKLHKLAYQTIRQQSSLSAQVVVRAIAKVAAAYKLDHKRQRTFRKLGSIAYDERILRWYPAIVSIWTTAGRQRIGFVCAPNVQELLKVQQGESDLALRDGKWYLLTTINYNEPPAGATLDFIGVDLGIGNIATDSDGIVHSGALVNGLRKRHVRLRAKLQAKGTTAGKRLLRLRRRKEHRFVTHTNHVLAKALVTKAKDTQRAIALENLKGIRTRITVSKAQRGSQHSWSFYQLRSFIEYKARRQGVAVVAVDPHNTSRTCPSCGCIDKKNRVSQSKFRCVSCSFAGLADHIAAGNIRGRALVSAPYAVTTSVVN